MRSFTDDQSLISATKISAAFTATNAGDLFTSNAHGLSDGNLITVATSGGTLPTGVTAGVWYYVVTATTNTFQVSATLGGTAIVLSADSVGTCTFYREKLGLMDVSSFDFVTVALASSGSAALAVRFIGAVTTALPDISQVQSTTNMWDHIGYKDIDTYAADIEDGVSGATGVVFVGTDKHQIVRCDVRGLKWFGALTQTWSAGTVVVKARSSSGA